eukprot:2889038-Alexandrium_andersonii.AAC.1
MPGDSAVARPQKRLASLTARGSTLRPIMPTPFADSDTSFGVVSGAAQFQLRLPQAMMSSQP